MMATNRSTLVCTAHQRWLTRFLSSGGICRMGVLWVLVKTVPFKWLFAVTVELAD